MKTPAPFDLVEKHPVKAAVLILATMIAALILTGGDFGWADRVAFVIVSAGLAALVAWKHLLATFLACSIIQQPLQAAEKPEAAAGGIVARIVVTCGFGYCVYRLAKFCQKKFPKEKPKKDPDEEELYGVPDDTDEYGGSWNFAPLGSCLPEDARLLARAAETERGTTFALTIVITSPHSLTCSMAADTSPGSWHTWAEFQADAASHGLILTDQADGSQYFSRNREPASAGEVPIRFGPEPGAVTVSSGTMVKVAVERSLDLQTWESLLTAQQPAGTVFRVLDTSIESSAFYRTRLIP